MIIKILVENTSIRETMAANMVLVYIETQPQELVSMIVSKAVKMLGW